MYFSHTCTNIWHCATVYDIVTTMQKKHFKCTALHQTYKTCILYCLKQYNYTKLLILIIKL